MDDGGLLTEAFDGAGADISVSADAMRWSPQRADTQADGVDCSTGLRDAVVPRLRRLVSRAVAPFAWVAADLADDARRLLRRQSALRS
jgi:serine/threonine-protein kinase RsbW